MPTKVKDAQTAADQAVKETANIRDFAYRGDLPLGKTWAFTFARNRDSDILDVSNYETIKEDLEKRFPKDVEEVHASHFAFGWVDHLAVKMLDKKGKVTKAGIAALEWVDKLESYPVADEEDYSRRELEATLENIEFEGGLDADTAGDVYRWLSDNEPGTVESSDDKGGYPSKEKIEEALWAIGKPTEEMVEEKEEAEREEEESLTPEEREAKRRREFRDPPEQMRMFGKGKRRAIRERGEDHGWASKQKLINFLEGTLIPDLKESGSDAMAEDFETGIAYLRGAHGKQGMFEDVDHYMDFLEGTLIPDLYESGRDAMAEDYESVLFYLWEDAFEKPTMGKDGVTQEEKDEFMDLGVLLDGEPARIVGRRLPVATVRTTDGSRSAEFSWDAVKHVVETKEGRFRT